MTWPRLVVAIGPPEGDAAEPGLDGGDIQVVVVDGDVVVPPGLEGGCPADNQVIDCQYMFFGAPGETAMTLRVSVGSGPPTEKVIQLKAFNYCGNDLAYVVVTFSKKTPAPVIAEPKYVSPCEASP